MTSILALPPGLDPLAVDAVFCDLDGTLVRADGRVSPRTVAAIRCARERGVEVVAVTGRPPRWLAGFAGLAEAVAFTKAAGLDADKVLDAVSGGSAQSWQMVNRWPTMVRGEFDFGFAVDWMRKDLGLTLDEARRNGASLPVAALLDQFYADVQKMGGGRQDTSSLVRRLIE